MNTLHDAAEKGDLVKVQALLTSHPELVHKQDTYGCTPLHMAAYGGSQEVVEMLLACQAIVNVRDNAGRIPADYAEVKGHLELAKRLKNADTFSQSPQLAQKSSINPPDKIKPVAVITKCSQCGKSLTLSTIFSVFEERLCQNCIIIDKREFNLGCSAGISMLLFFVILVIALIIGTDPSTGQIHQVPSVFVWLAILFSVYALFMVIRNAVRSHRLKNTTFIEHRKNAAIIEELIRNGADVNAKDTNGDPALITVTKKGDADSVKVLLAHGANVYAADRMGYTAQKYAASSLEIDVLLTQAVSAAKTTPISRERIEGKQAPVAGTYHPHFVLMPIRSTIKPDNPPATSARQEHATCCLCGRVDECKGLHVYVLVAIDVRYNRQVGLVGMNVGHSQVTYERYLGRYGMFFCPQCVPQEAVDNWLGRQHMKDDLAYYRLFIEQYVVKEREALISACNLKGVSLWTGHITGGDKYSDHIHKWPTAENLKFVVEPAMEYNHSVLKDNSDSEWKYYYTEDVRVL